MTNAEAIETLRVNYPDACFEQLRCAVDMAIKALTKEAWKEEHPVSPLLQKLAMNLQPCKQDADDTISRAAAIAIAKDLLIHLEEYHQYNQAINNYCAEIIKLPSAQPEIVQCKDCKYGAPNGKYGCRVYHYKRYETHDMKPDDFCSFAERKTNE